MIYAISHPSPVTLKKLARAFKPCVDPVNASLSCGRGLVCGWLGELALQYQDELRECVFLDGASRWRSA